MNTNQFSKETQEILDTRLPWWLRWGNLLLLFFIALVFLLLLLIKVQHKNYYPVYYYALRDREVILVYFPQDKIPEPRHPYKLITNSKLGNIAITTGPFEKYGKRNAYIQDIPPQLDIQYLKNGEQLGELEVEENYSLLTYFFSS